MGKARINISHNIDLKRPDNPTVTLLIEEHETGLVTFHVDLTAVEFTKLMRGHNVVVTPEIHTTNA